MDELNYEKAMERLSEIVKTLENDSSSLEKSLELFEEGTKLASFCTKTLDEAELKVTKLSNEE